MQRTRDIITVDGLGASGKSSLAKRLAQELGYSHLNSGLLYRGIAWLGLKEGIDLTNERDVCALLEEHTIRLVKDCSNNSVVMIDEAVLAEELMGADVANGASLVARHQRLRDALVDTQRLAFLPGGLVAEGRDMGTVIFPEARVKFFVTARLDVRAERRYRQLLGTAQESSLEQIRSELKERDARDSSSSVGKTKKADTAILIDNSDESFEDIVAKMHTYTS